jgi:rSAM/selenodomain-associated transferase 2
MKTLSVIIPTWCEAAVIEDAIASARRVGDEVIVADAGSPDGTASIAASQGARVVVAPKGRGAQLRAGAEAATGAVLVFVHADAKLGPGAREAILRELAQPGVIGGNFYLLFEGQGLFARLFTWANDWRRRLFRVYYGDSVLFVRREIYEQLGGFEPFPIFEDYDFVRRLERSSLGRTVYIRDVTVSASARRFEQAPVRTLMLWGVLHTLYSVAHVHPDRLVGLYTDVRRGFGKFRSRTRSPDIAVRSG